MTKGQQRDPNREVRWREVPARHSRSGLNARQFCRYVYSTLEGNQLRFPIDLHLVAISMMCIVVLLLLRSVITPAIGGSILATVLQLPLLTRAVSQKRGSAVNYIIINELIVALGVGLYLMVRLL